MKGKVFAVQTGTTTGVLRRVVVFIPQRKKLLGSKLPQSQWIMKSWLSLMPLPGNMETYLNSPARRRQEVEATTRKSLLGRESGAVRALSFEGQNNDLG